MANYSVLIKNGIVYDGEGSSPQRADIGISDNKIKNIGDLSSSNASITIDAKDRFVCPGFIDLTNHSDTHWTLLTSPGQENLVRQGITTVIGGNCGSSVAPLAGKKGLESIQKWVDISSININWQTVDEFLSLLETRRTNVNFGMLVGYGTLRNAVIGDDTRAANEEENAKIKYLLDASLSQGAFGFSTNLGSYQKRYLRDDEIVGLLKIVAKRNGLAKHHLEDEGKNILPAISRIIQITRESGVRSQISHFKAVGKTAWSLFYDGLAMIRKARDEGLKITCDFSPYDITGSTLYMLLPMWAREMNKNKLMEALRDRKSKERRDLLSYLKDLTLHYDRIIVASTQSELDQIGKSISELEKLTELPGEEIILNLLEVNNFQVTIFNQAVSEENIKKLAMEDYSMIASDGMSYPSPGLNFRSIPHPRSYGAYPRALSIFAKNGMLKWEEVIRKMTSQPADALGLKDRGRIKKGYFADLVIFDPKTIEDRATPSNSGAFPNGIETVIINGKVVFNEGKMSAALPGVVLRKKQ